MNGTKASTPADPEQHRSESQRAMISEPSSSTADSERTDPTAIVEVFPGVAAVFGAVPEGLERIDLEASSPDGGQLAQLLGVAGNTSTIAGNLAAAISGSQGLYRLSGASMALLKSGGQLAVKDGAHLGAILKNGKLVAQARLIPYGLTAAEAVAAIGPAVAMAALQMMIGQVSQAVERNAAVTNQILSTVQQEQQAKLTGLVKEIDEKLRQAIEIGGVAPTLWETIAPHDHTLREQLDLYPTKVQEHIHKLHSARKAERRQYVEKNAAAIYFDAQALLLTLKAKVGYQALYVARLQARGTTDPLEARQADVALRDTKVQFDEQFQLAIDLLVDLTRELHLITEISGSSTWSFPWGRQDDRVSREVCAKLLEVIEPLINAFHPGTPELKVPDVTCAPADFDVDPYLRVLRWLLDDGEVLRGLALSHIPNQLGVLAAQTGMLDTVVDNSWKSLAPDVLASSSLIAITNQRIVTANPQTLRSEGKLGDCFDLTSIRNVRPPEMHDNQIRRTITVTTERRDLTWMFPQAADDDAINQLAELLQKNLSEEKSQQLAVNESQATADAPGPLLDRPPRTDVSAK